MGTDVMQWDSGQAMAAARLREVLDRRGKPIRRARGIYLYGRPGRGKTMLMNRFFTEVASKRKRRYHFHRFFNELHTAKHELGSLDAAVDALLGDALVVCFDEFHVHDIGDAMLLARLLDVLFARRVLLVLTSNYPPHDLLPNPLFHDRFVPTIERILAGMDVLPVDGPVDYRTLGVWDSSRTGFTAGRYLVAPGPDTARAASSTLSASTSGSKSSVVKQGDSVAEQQANESAVEIVLGARTVRAIAAYGATLVIDFAGLCGVPTSPADYVALAQRFRRWEIRDIPLLRTAAPDPVMRLVNVIDVLYDADRELTVVAPTPLDELVRDVRGIPDIARLASRLGALSRSVPAVAE
ncbi:cell division protein ZapE [Nocardia sp. 004]|uniref:cell division protein ZapE n=1 Tax=Nocardia sp. 004 TaxID=3385978 RepID=UPI0039A19DE5